jgi:N-acetylneuraminate synthase
MSACVRIGDRKVGPGMPTYVIAEIGINHNGSVELAKKLIDAAALAGCDAVKFQKRTPALSTPAAYRDVKRETPWGLISYLEYRERIEFGREQYDEIARYCREKPIDWFASCWDLPSVDFISRYEPVCCKIASASVTDSELLRRVAGEGKPVILSTGMSTMEQIEAAVSVFPREKLLIAHSTSTYPCKPAELNLTMIRVLAERYGRPVGYSGHEVGLQTTLAAVVLGAAFVERHITLDRSMWGTDQAASIEPGGLVRLVRDIRVIESAMGDGVKRVYDSEQPSIEKLRRPS